MSSRIRMLAVASVAALGALGAGSAAAVTVPQAVTGHTLKVTAGSATLTGVIAPAGYAVTYTFEYGTSTRYTSVTVPLTLPASTSNEYVSATISGLKPQTTYHYILIAEVHAVFYRYYVRAVGFYGSDVAFTTTKSPTSRVSLGATKAAVRRGSAVIALRCKGDERCTGTLTLTASHRTLATGAYSVKAGRKTKLHLALNPYALGLLHGGKTVTARCSAKAGSGEKGFRNRKVKL